MTRSSVVGLGLLELADLVVGAADLGCSSCRRSRRDATCLPSDSFSRLVSFACVSSATSRFLSESLRRVVGGLVDDVLVVLDLDHHHVRRRAAAAAPASSPRPAAAVAAATSGGGCFSSGGGGAIATSSGLSSSFSASIGGGGDHRRQRLDQLLDRLVVGERDVDLLGLQAELGGDLGVGGHRDRAVEHVARGGLVEQIATQTARERIAEVRRPAPWACASGAAGSLRTSRLSTEHRGQPDLGPGRELDPAARSHDLLGRRRVALGWTQDLLRELPDPHRGRGERLIERHPPDHVELVRGRHAPHERSLITDPGDQDLPPALPVHADGQRRHGLGSARLVADVERRPAPRPMPPRPGAAATGCDMHVVDGPPRVQCDTRKPDELSRSSRTSLT